MNVILKLIGWLCIFIIPMIGYSFKNEFSNLYERVAATIIPGRYWLNDQGEIIINKSADGHFYIDALLNNTKISFLVDTGATTISLSQKDARSLGVNIASLDFYLPYSTANGYNYAAPIKLHELQLGPKTFKDISANVVRGNMDVSLLGMSLLRQFKSFRIDGDQLILSY